MDVLAVSELGDVPAGAVVTADVCIVGTGPAGSTLARELAGSGLDVLLLESGGLRREAESDALAEIVSTGRPRVTDPWAVHNRVLGGTSTTWSGRVAAFDEVDFRARPWVPHSGWPWARGELEPYLERSRAHLGAPVADNTSAAVAERLERCFPGVDRRVLRPYGWTYSRDAVDPGDHMRFGRRALEGPDVGDLAGVRCLLHATVTHVDTEPGPGDRRVRGVEVRGSDGAVRRVQAATVVLCAGGIENARLLLASDRDVPGGLGNQHDLVGRFLMDHLRGPVARWSDRQARVVQRWFGPVRLATADGPVQLTPGLVLTPQVQEDEGLVNAALFLSAEIDERDPVRALRALSRRQDPLVNLLRILRRPGLVLESLWRLAGRQRGELRLLREVELHVIAEQVPDPDSRITLSDRTDRHGVRLPEVHWRIGEQDERTVHRAARAFVAEAARAGLPVPRLVGPVEDGGALDVLDVAHPTGSTRMAATPTEGVVDGDGQVFGVGGLFVAGSSVFPTSGHANPTQTVVALAVRLADHLRARAGTAGR
ncbi:FAD-dependent oxidoreductase [Klenkia sp. PcliD-1-E]|uniref:FAD-dependent oxidoreductase n=1 Tax=Klenkia sp. PcliD-1-E TaxID=2954492 RepID=UPI002096850C|nr:GMC family oxidoreductase [Klenkia sp. PcliD-1-E]MCO7220226.1 GMC family oxidoreductase [Klenkia sp. PcliD-1-E]